MTAPLQANHGCLYLTKTIIFNKTIEALYKGPGPVCGVDGGDCVSTAGCGAGCSIYLETGPRNLVHQSSRGITSQYCRNILDNIRENNASEDHER